MPKVLVTGSGRRLGKAIALCFARKGWDVIVHYNSSKEGAQDTFLKIMEMGQSAYIIKADLTKGTEIKKAFADAFRNFGVPAVLINNAGIYPDAIKLDDINDEVWDNTLDINTKAVMLCSKYFVRYAFPNSRIINITSLGGLEVWKNRIPYNTSKAATIHLTRALALELAPNLSVNSINPGIVQFDDDEMDEIPKPSPDKIPMKRYATPEEIFEAVYFFSTCSPYITGQNISIDGGSHYQR